ncbi:MAG: ABC transporter permease [Acidobacteria bacterium]|nr:ABC transporter permease [Acidobacteriota bacterium]
MRFVLANAYREYRIRLTNPVLPLWDVVVPVIYLLIFGASLDRWFSIEMANIDYPLFFLGGVLAMVTFSVAMNSSYTFFEDIQSGIFHELLTYPFARRDLMFGRFLFNALFSLAGSALCLLAARYVLEVPLDFMRIQGLVFWLVVGTAGWYFFFSWLALSIRGFNAYHTTTSSLYILLMFISDLFYPLDKLPPSVQMPAYWNPITWEIDLLRHFTYGPGTWFEKSWESAGFLIFAGVSYWLANRSLNSSLE